MASPGRSSIVLFWRGRKLIVLLQLLPFSSPHRERPALVLMGLPKYWDGAALHLVWDWKMWIQRQLIPPGIKIQAFRLLIPSCLLTYVCTSVRKNIFNAAGISKNISLVAELQVKNKQGRTEILLVGYRCLAALFSLNQQGQVTFTL